MPPRKSSIRRKKDAASSAPPTSSKSVPASSKSAAGAKSATASSKSVNKDRVLTGYDTLLGNGEELSAKALMGYGTINIIYDLNDKVGEDLEPYLSWARWNRREAPRDKVMSLRDSIITHLEMGDHRVALPIPIHQKWLSDPKQLVKSIEGKENDQLPVITFNLRDLRHEDLRPFGGNVSAITNINLYYKC
jgi:hypothetical protein